MNFRAATGGQIKQIIDKVIKAVPADSFSFDEANRFLRDVKMSHEIMMLLRSHSLNEPVKVRVPENALEVLLDLKCEFLVHDELLEFHRVKTWGDKTSQKLLPIFGSLTREENAPKEVHLEAIGFENGTTPQEIVGRLADMGYRPANFIEAVGFLQAKGKTFRNPGRSEGAHGFYVISEPAAPCQISCYREVSRRSVWHIAGIGKDAFKWFSSPDILVAKL